MGNLLLGYALVGCIPVLLTTGVVSWVLLGIQLIALGIYIKFYD